MKARLALVDDDPAFTSYMGTVLRSRGYDVDVFHRGTELLKSLHGGAAFNVILLDVQMPISTASRRCAPSAWPIPRPA